MRTPGSPLWAAFMTTPASSDRSCSSRDMSPLLAACGHAEHGARSAIAPWSGARRAEERITACGSRTSFSFHRAEVGDEPSMPFARHQRVCGCATPAQKPVLRPAFALCSAFAGQKAKGLIQ